MLQKNIVQADKYDANTTSIQQKITVGLAIGTSIVYTVLGFMIELKH